MDRATLAPRRAVGYWGVSARNRPVLLGVMAGLAGWFGAMWDIAWHGDLGRDTFFTPPHLMILGGVVAGGLAGAWALARVPGARRPGPRRGGGRPGVAGPGGSPALA